MATGANFGIEQQEGPFELLVHPSSTLYEDIFLLRTPFSINKEAACIKSFAGRPALYSSELDTFVGISAVVQSTAAILHKHGVSHRRVFHDSVSPLYAMDVSSQLSSLKSFLSKSDKVKTNLAESIEDLFKNDLPTATITVEADFKLYHVSPKTGTASPNVRLVTLANISHYSNAYKESKMFDFSSALFDQAEEDHEAGCDKQVEKVVLSDLLKEFTCVASSWLSLGVQLGIPKEILFKIQKECPHSMDDCLLKVLSYWEDNATPTWSMVIEALCRINKKMFAIKLSSKHCVPLPIDEQQLEEVKECQEHLKQAEGALKEVRDSECLVDVSMWTSKVEELVNERETLEKQLENEQELCRVLNKCKEDYIQEKKGFQKRLKKQDESHFAKLRAIEHQVNEREEAIKKLKGDLVVTNQAYQDIKDQLRKLSSELAEKTTELEGKSFHLRTLNDTQIEDSHHSEVEARQTLECGDILLKAAREESQEAYLLEIQLSHAEQEVDQEKENISHLNTHISQLEDDVSKVSNELKVNQEQLQQLKLRAAAKSHQNDDVNEDVLKLQIVVTKMNIRLVNSRYQLILTKRELKSAQEEYKQCAHRQQTKKQLMPDHSKCRIEGLDLPLHKTVEPVKVIDVVRELYKAMDMWFSLGVHFNVPTYQLFAWKKEHRDSPIECLTAMLQWLLENQQLTWANVVQALFTIERRSLARDICSKFGVTFPAEENEKRLKRKRKNPSQQTLMDVEELEIRGQRMVADAKASTEEVRGDIQKVIKEEYPAMKVKVDKLTRQKEELIEKLELERKECDLLLEYRKQSRKSDEKVSSLERMSQEKERSLTELQRKLEESELEYQQARQRLSSLMKELTEQTNELERKSSVLRELEDTQQEDDCELRAKRTMKDEELRRQTARSISQSEYIAEIEFQLSTAKQEVESYNQQIEKLRLSRLKLESELSIIGENLQEKKKHLQEKISSQTTPSVGVNQADEIALQIYITKLNIQLVDLRPEYALAKTKLKTTQSNLEQRMLSVRLNKNLLPDLTKCNIERLDLPLHKTSMKIPIQFKVHLCDRDGEPCTGEHVVTARETRSQELLVAEPDEESGTYTLTYTPRIPGEHSFSVFINDVPLNSQPLYTLVYNTPHLPNCTVSGEGLHSAERNVVASFKVNLVDEDGHPVAAEQTVSASLSQEGGDCLVLPPDVATTETAGMYVVSYLPGRSGVCELTVLVNGKPIGGGSFRVDVEKTVCTLLTGAAYSGHQRFLLALLNKGADVNERDENGFTALHEASSEGQKDTVDLLLLKGARVDSQINDGDTALHQASFWGYKDTVELLVQKGAQVDSKNNFSQTALDIARSRGHTEVCKILQSHK